ncbi:hypothetical protein H5410_001623 [Solanum commersonii]|uniref:Uncharacterized protein n=1 Tax=Solanum commersonii TaxID=4109 RepID=A0A9J6B042_SOLCO|nr:hypothetical protein H5410_001623 [Solanum commersonii]
MHTTRLNLLMQGSLVYSNIQIVTHHYQGISCSQYLLLVQVQAQPKVSKCPDESDTTLTLKKRNKMHVSTHRFALIFQLTFDSPYSRSKRSF